MRLIYFFRSLPPLGRLLLSVDIFLEIMGFVFIVKLLS